MREMIERKARGREKDLTIRLYLLSKCQCQGRQLVS